MNPVYSSQAPELMALMDEGEATRALMYLEMSHLPYDVQDLIFAALQTEKHLNLELVESVLESYCSLSSFDERLLH